MGALAWMLVPLFVKGQHCMNRYTHEISEWNYSYIISLNVCTMHMARASIYNHLYMPLYCKAYSDLEYCLATYRII